MHRKAKEWSIPVVVSAATTTPRGAIWAREIGKRLRTRGTRNGHRMQNSEVHILLVEDDLGDIVMTQEAFEHYKIRNPLHVVNDGAEALEFLHRAGAYRDAPRPGLIMLDLNLPKVHGREVLSSIKNDEQLRTIPVVVLTTSRAEEDILRSYHTHANAYVTKPVDFHRFMDVIRQIDSFFVTVVELPN
jgi:CheY-like chemotaxis protein